MMAGGSFLFSCNKKEAPFLGRLPWFAWRDGNSV